MGKAGVSLEYRICARLFLRDDLFFQWLIYEYFSAGLLVGSEQIEESRSRYSIRCPMHLYWACCDEPTGCGTTLFQVRT